MDSIEFFVGKVITIVKDHYIFKDEANKRCIGITSPVVRFNKDQYYEFDDLKLSKYTDILEKFYSVYGINPYTQHNWKYGEAIAISQSH